MKKTLFAVCLSTVMIFSVSVGWAVPTVGPWNYSTADSILGYESLHPANEAQELAFANSVLTALGMAPTQLLDGTGRRYVVPGDIDAKEAVYSPGFAWLYAVVKVDGPNDFSYLFWDNYMAGGDDILQTPRHGTTPFNVGNNGKGYGISHITWFGPTSVPEPGMLALLGMGLVGIGIFRRRK